MTGILRLMIALAVLVSAIYAVIWLWTGSLPAYGAQVMGTLAIITVVSIVILVISRPSGRPKAP